MLIMYSLLFRRDNKSSIFGKNPNRGGRPPNLNRLVINSDLIWSWFILRFSGNVVDGSCKEFNGIRILEIIIK